MDVKTVALVRTAPDRSASRSGKAFHMYDSDGSVP